MTLKSDINVDIWGENAETCFLFVFCLFMGTDYGLVCRHVASLFLGRMCLNGFLGTGILPL